MGLPPNLKWVNRIAKAEKKFYFLCQKKREHPSGGKSGPHPFRFRSDAEAFRAAHDTAYHGRILAHLGIAPHLPVSPHALCRDWLAYQTQLVERGRNDPQTLHHYQYVSAIIQRAFKPSEDLTGITPARISAFVHWMGENTNTEGAVTIKVLSALRTMLRWKGAEPRWKIPTRDIDPQPAEKRNLEAELIVRLIEAMPRGSVEEAAAALKARTGIREVEIRLANVEDVDFEERLIAPLLHAKRKRKRHAYPLEDDVLELLRPFTDGKKPGDPLLDLHGRRLEESSLRVRLKRASGIANITPPIQSLGPIRSEVATVIKERRSLKAAQEWLGHDDARTTLKWYVKDRMTAQKLQEMRRVAKILKQVVPLPRLS